MLIRSHSHSDEEQWAPVSDLMAVIMLVFMLIAMLLFVSFDLDKRINIERCEETKDMLETQFKYDFANWGAILEEDLTIRFTNQRVLFGSDSFIINPWFAGMLRNFFPRYMGVIKNIRGEFGEGEVLAIRIEGHTSREYENPGAEDPFIKNMELSQNRAREILKYVLDLNRIHARYFDYGALARRLTTANGLSSSRLICSASCEEDKKASRRVEFKLLTKSCQKAGVYDEIARSIRKCPGTGMNCVPK
ncbi:MAG: OmpA family protein [Gammaproteobacteria bacterium]